MRLKPDGQDLRLDLRKRGAVAQRPDLFSSISLNLVLRFCSRYRGRITLEINIKFIYKFTLKNFHLLVSFSIKSKLLALVGIDGNLRENFIYLPSIRLGLIGIPIASVR